MSRKITIQSTEGAEAPWAIVPSRHMWSLVEYLAYRRTQVHYTYGSQQFYVRFPCLDRQAAQEVLNEWAASRDPMHEAVPRALGYEVLLPSL